MMGVPRDDEDDLGGAELLGSNSALIDLADKASLQLPPIPEREHGRHHEEEVRNLE